MDTFENELIKEDEQIKKFRDNLDLNVLFEETTTQSTLRDINGFRNGDLVKLKPEWVDKGEEGKFHVIKEWSKRYAYLILVVEGAEAQLFPCQVKTLFNMIEPTIYANVAD